MKTTQNEEAKEAGRPAGKQTDGRRRWKRWRKIVWECFDFEIVATYFFIFIFIIIFNININLIKTKSKIYMYTKWKEMFRDENINHQIP